MRRRKNNLAVNHWWKPGGVFHANYQAGYSQRPFRQIMMRRTATTFILPG
jgi:hypothetical protein